MKVTNISVEDIKYDLSKFSKHEARIKSLLPTKKREIISFVVRNSDTPTVNGLRRTLIEEMPVKILTTSVEDIETDEEFLIRDELIDRIHSIPIDQRIKDDATFYIDSLNTDTAKRIGFIYSVDVLPNSGSAKDLNNVMDERFRIAELHPGKHLRVNNIRILMGYGYMHANFMMTCGIKYKPLDFIDVTKVNERGFFERGMVAADDVLPFAKKQKASITELTVQSEKILFIPSDDAKNHMSIVNKERIKEYTIVINKDVQFKSSSVSHPTTYFMEVETLGNMPARPLVKAACDNLIERLQKVHDGLEVYLKNPEAEPTDPSVIADVTQKMTRVEIKGETHTIAEILVFNVQKLDPTVSNIKKHIIHPMTRSVVINVCHAEPIRILMDACKMGIANYKMIEGAF